MNLDIIYNEDCIGKKGMCILLDKSIDMVLCDMPYGRTACKQDTIIPFEPLWVQYKRVIKDNGAIVLTASQPFTSMLVMSNLKMFKYEWIWKKTRPTGFFTAKKIPMKIHENIIVFYYKQPTYNPIKIDAPPEKIDRRKTLNPTYSPYLGVRKERVADNGERYPITIQEFASISQKGQHPTQKPIALFEYLIKTYTNEGDIVLDNCIGSGTTAIACRHLKHHYVGYEISKEYCKIAEQRLEEERTLWYKNWNSK